MPPKSLATYISEVDEVTSLGTGDRVLTLEGGVVKYVDGADVSGGGGGGITALTGDVTASGTGSVAATIASGAVTNAKVASGIDAVKLADGSISNTEFQYLNGVTSAIQTQLDAKQTLDSDLTTIAGLTPTNDDVMQYKAGAWANRTLAQLKTDLSLQPLDATLTAFAGLTIAANTLTIGTGADAFAQTAFAANTFPGRSSTGDLAAKTITDFGFSLVDDADASTARTTLGLGTLATQSGTFSGTSSGTNTGDQTISLTGDVTGSGTGSFAATIAASAVTLAKMADMATASILGRNTAGTGAPEVLKRKHDKDAAFPQQCRKYSAFDVGGNDQHNHARHDQYRHMVGHRNSRYKRRHRVNGTWNGTATIARKRRRHGAGILHTVGSVRRHYKRRQHYRCGGNYRHKRRLWVEP